MIGAAVERQAVVLLKKQRLKILATNFNTKLGEIDIIAGCQATRTIVFVEVKYRKHHYFGYANEMVSYSKQIKLFRTAQIYLMQNPQFKSYNYRFDVIAKTADSVEWIKNAFEIN